MASASVVTSIRIDRYEHPHRPIRASASTDTSIRIDRYECLRRSMRMIKIECKTVLLYYLLRSITGASLISNCLPSPLPKLTVAVESALFSLCGAL